MALEWWMAALIIIAAALASAQLFKKFFKAQVFAFLFSVIRTKKPVKWLESASKPKIFQKIAYAGIFLGFGGVAFDYFYYKKFSLWKRAILFALTAAVLSLTAYGVLAASFSTANSILSNEVLVFFSLAFGVFGVAGFGVASLAFQAWWILSKMLVGERAIAGIAPIIPGVQVPNVPIFVPLHGWISLVILLLIHEGMHGIMMKKYLVKIKSTGLLFAGFLPLGAFVEPDQKQLYSTKPKKLLEILAAGPTANMIAFAVLIPVFAGLFALTIAPAILPNPQITTVQQELVVGGEKIVGPAFGAGIQKGSLVLEANNVPVKNTQEFMDAAALDSERMVLKIQEPDGGVVVKEMEKAGGIVGVQVSDHDLGKRSESTLLFTEFIFWLMALNFFAALANFLPVEPFDGGKMAKPLIAGYFGFLKMGRADTEKLVGKAFIWIMGLLILINVLPLFVF